MDMSKSYISCRKKHDGTDQASSDISNWPSTTTAAFRQHPAQASSVAKEKQTFLALLSALNRSNLPVRLP